MFRFRFLVLTLLLAVAFAACTVAEPTEVSNTAAEPDMATAGEDELVETSSEVEDEHEETAAESTAGEEIGDGETAASSERPAWQQMPLTNARTGASFTFADFAGKTIFVEPMATWCTNCRRQLMNVSQAHAEIGSDDVVFVALSVETSLAPEQLAQYAEAAGFDWHFAVMSQEMLQQLVEAFGRSIANPPATPHFVIRPDGTTSELVTGIEPAAQIVAQIEAARG